MIRHFQTPWPDVPTVWLDTETTGLRPGKDKAVQVGLCRIERGEVVGSFESLVNPGISIPAESSEVHGITDKDVLGAPTIDDVFALSEVKALLEGAQPGGYNTAFDRDFLPAHAFLDWRWPWLDCLTMVRTVDRFVRGQGRHRLEVAAQRHGIPLTKAHSALSDAKGAGLLFVKLAKEHYRPDLPLGRVLANQLQDEAGEWLRFNDWRSKQGENNV